MHLNFKTRSICTRVPFCTFSFHALFSQSVFKSLYIALFSRDITASTRKGSLVQSQYRPPIQPIVSSNVTKINFRSNRTSFNPVCYISISDRQREADSLREQAAILISRANKLTNEIRIVK